VDSLSLPLVQKTPVTSKNCICLFFELVKGRLAAFFAKEKSEGRLAEDASSELLADFCIATIQGAMLLGKVKKDSQPVEATVRETLVHLKGYSIARNLAPRKSP